MKNVLPALVAAIALVAVAPAAQADFFSVSADLPLQYNFDAGDSADSVSGYKVAVSLPFLVGFGFEGYTVTSKSSGTTADGEVTFVDVFVNLPIPFVNIGAGIGVGTASTTLSPEVTGLVYDDTSLFQYFLTVGIPIAVLFDVHLGYHVISGSSDIKQDGSKTGDVVFDGNMISLGAKVGF